MLTRHTLIERQKALIQHYLHQLDDLRQMYLQGQDRAQVALREFDYEWQQLQAQQKWAVNMASRDSAAAQLVVAFPEKAGTLMLQIAPREAAAWLEDALAWVDVENHTTRYELLFTNYDVRKHSLDTDRMREIVESLAALADRLDDDSLRARVAYLTADYYDTLDDYPNQLVWSEQAVELAMRLEDEPLIAEARYALGFGCLRLSQFNRANEQLRLALEFFQKAGLRLKEASLWNALAMNAYYQSRADEAVTYAEHALAIAREISHRKREMIQLSNLALFTMGNADLEKALLYGRQAFIAARESGVHHAVPPALTALLYTLLELGLADELHIQVEQARQLLHEDLARAHTQMLEIVIDLSRAYMAYEQGDWLTACQLAQQTALATRDFTNGDEEYDAAFLWGSSLIELKAFDEAAAVFARCLALYHAQTENPVSRSGALAGLSYAEALRGNRAYAQQLIDEFLAVLGDNEIGQVNCSSLTTWNAHCALLALEDERITLLRAKYNTFHQKVLSHLPDETLRTSYLKKTTIQRLMAVLDG